MHRFVAWYNHEHRHSALHYVTPAQRHSGEATHVLARRRATYERARQARPERWAGNVRDFGWPEQVHLHPEQAESD